MKTFLKKSDITNCWRSRFFIHWSKFKLPFLGTYIVVVVQFGHRITFRSPPKCRWHFQFNLAKINVTKWPCHQPFYVTRCRCHQPFHVTKCRCHQHFYVTICSCHQMNITKCPDTNLNLISVRTIPGRTISRGPKSCVTISFE